MIKHFNRDFSVIPKQIMCQLCYLKHLIVDTAETMVNQSSHWLIPQSGVLEAPWHARKGERDFISATQVVPRSITPGLEQDHQSKQLVLNLTPPPICLPLSLLQKKNKIKQDSSYNGLIQHISHVHICTGGPGWISILHVLAHVLGERENWESFLFAPVPGVLCMNRPPLLSIV